MEDEVFGYDFSQGYTSLERSTEVTPPRPGMFSRWLQAMRESRTRRRRAQEAAEDRQVDDILSRLHRDGYDSLTPAERALLKRVSARYRGRADVK